MADSKAKSIVSGLVAVVLIGGLAYKNYDSQTHVKEFNAYIKGAQALLVEQDTLVEEYQKTPDAAMLEKLPDYLKRSDALTDKFKAIKIVDPEVAAMNPYFVQRSEAISEALKRTEKYIKSQKEEDLVAVKVKWTEAGQHLAGFVAKRDAYFKKHDLKLEK